MGKTYLLIDFNNMFFRMKHVSMKGASLDERIGMVFHQTLNGVRSAWKRFDGDHCIFALEGKSWRKQVFPEYKMNRVAQRLKRTDKEIELDEEFQKAANDFIEYIQKYTNSSAVRSENAEADDIIATFILDRPDDNHIIVSADSDFYQLVNDRVTIFDPMGDRIITPDGVYDSFMKPKIDKKTKKQKELGDPNWLLFKKCMRGDSTDNVSSAYPRLREKSTKNRVGMVDAFKDRNNKGYEWNTVMLHEWEDHKGKNHKVLDLYERNKLLIDLKEIPEPVKNEIRRDIEKEANKEVQTSTIGFNFMKFCQRYGLIRISEQSSYYMDFLGRKYV